MNDFFKYLWLWAILFTIFALLAAIPVTKYEKKFKNYAIKRHYIPQMHIDAAHRYLEAVESGEIDNIYQFGYAPEYLRMLDNSYERYGSTDSKPIPPKTIRPLYIRDKNNPEIIYPYPAGNTNNPYPPSPAIHLDVSK